MTHTPDPTAVGIYTTAEIDEMVAGLEAADAALDARVTALETGAPPEPPDPGNGGNPGPEPTGVDLDIAEFVVGDLAVGTPANLAVAVINVGDTDVPPGYDAVIGVGFTVDGQVATWCSTDAGLPAGQSITLDTGTAPMTGGPWTPTAAGVHVLEAFVDDLNRIPEWDETNNTATTDVTIADGPPPPEHGAATLFVKSSLWNTVKTPTEFAAGADGLLSGLTYGINNGAFGHPMTWSTTADPIHTIDTPNSWGWPAQTLRVNMRDDAQPASGSDGHLCLLNADGRLVDMWILRPTGTRAWRCESYAMHNWHDGSGFGTASPFQSAGVCAAGVPTGAGTITAAEVDANDIPHALCMAFDYGHQGGVNTSWSPGIFPAIANDVGGGPGPICEGALLVAAGNAPGGMNPAETALWHAAATYGCYVIDKLDGNPMFYGDNSATVGNAFRGDKVTAIGRKLRMVKTW